MNYIYSKRLWSIIILTFIANSAIAAAGHESELDEAKGLHYLYHYAWGSVPSHTGHVDGDWLETTTQFYIRSIKTYIDSKVVEGIADPHFHRIAALIEIGGTHTNFRSTLSNGYTNPHKERIVREIREYIPFSRAKFDALKATMHASFRTSELFPVLSELEAAKSSIASLSHAKAVSETRVGALELSLERALISKRSLEEKALKAESDLEAAKIEIEAYRAEVRARGRCSSKSLSRTGAGARSSRSKTPRRVKFEDPLIDAAGTNKDGK